MGNNDGCCKGTTDAEVAFNEILRELAGAVDQASYNAEAYKNKIRKLDNFELNCEMGELKCAPPAGCQAKEPPETVLYKLRMILDQLKSSNQKNDEILQHLNTLV